jgi:hypothetical protein
MKGSIKHVYNVLEGSDAVVFQCMRALGFGPALYVYYEEYGEDYDDEYSDPPAQGAMVDSLMDFKDSQNEETVFGIVQEDGGSLSVKMAGRWSTILRIRTASR